MRWVWDQEWILARSFSSERRSHTACGRRSLLVPAHWASLTNAGPSACSVNRAYLHATSEGADKGPRRREEAQEIGPRTRRGEVSAAISAARPATRRASRKERAQRAILRARRRRKERLPGGGRGLHASQWVSSRWETSRDDSVPRLGKNAKSKCKQALEAAR